MRPTLPTAALLIALVLPAAAQGPHSEPHPEAPAAAAPPPVEPPPVEPPAAPPPAPPLPRTLADIRGDIDAVDAQLLGLLNQRAALSGEVAATKRGEVNGGGPVFRPGRQAALLRRLGVDNRGPLSAPALARIWTEIIGSSIRIQRDLTVAFAGHETIAAPLAVEYFGTGMTLARARSPAALTEMVATGQADVGVVELDPGEESHQWWRRLLEPVNGRDLRVVARLPFIPPAPGHVRATGFILAPYDADPSGRDKVLLAVDADEGTNAKAIAISLEALGWKGVAVLDQGEAESGRGFLVEADTPEGQPGQPDPATGVLQKVKRIGGYAVPLSAGE